MTTGTLCSGLIDFMARGAEKAGVEVKYNCEIDPYCRKVLHHRFPNAHQYKDIIHDHIDIWTNIVALTFECYDISKAKGNKARGVRGNGYPLWVAARKIVDRLRPNYLLFENSPEIRTRGFEIILSELATIGYDAEWQCLSLASFGVQQDRTRLYLIAYPAEIRRQGRGAQAVFQQSTLSRQFEGVAPGWRTRSDIPQPRVIGNNDGFKHRRKRTEGIGNSGHWRAAKYLYECCIDHFKLLNNGNS